MVFKHGSNQLALGEIRHQYFNARHCFQRYGHPNLLDVADKRGNSDTPERKTLFQMFIGILEKIVLKGYWLTGSLSEKTGLDGY